MLLAYRSHSAGISSIHVCPGVLWKFHYPLHALYSAYTSNIQKKLHQKDSSQTRPQCFQSHPGLSILASHIRGGHYCHFLRRQLPLPVPTLDVVCSAVTGYLHMGTFQFSMVHHTFCPCTTAKMHFSTSQCQTHLPMSGGRRAREMSLRASTVRLRSCVKPSGSLWKRQKTW